MGVFIGFSIKCNYCGHNTRPHPNARSGIELVLTGQFDTCRKCHTQFDNITIPKRPMVMAVLNELTASQPLSSKAVLEDYDGKVPMAMGY